jgi:NAD(P)-dependent dehydrogenase (short-subunit alcohol dehydrogenase family)
MTGPTQGQNVVIIARGSGLARAAVLPARDAGATVVAADRLQEAPTPPTPASLASPARSWI